ncbi:Transcription factor HNF-4 homolog [Strongyloides ratti]|uniref:Transcription factor HNF-4 homolog n=1 Tax=Strongyloides ratti TaxID=34506 RepID=A0A090LKA4_STRRB|nr:Transcription factor HNF-4 homolog [Strongyloides ratti]CEF70197.1 Transcription factor HNF-4 homolog [Strongyloides ratti]
MVKTFSTNVVTNDLKTTKDLSDKIAPTKCVICNGPTSFYHYGISSCNGCKQFFRRIIVTGKVYKCKSLTGKCNLNENKRCKYCRFVKCLEMGMEPLSVKNEKKIIGSRNNSMKVLKSKFKAVRESSYDPGVLLCADLNFLLQKKSVLSGVDKFKKPSNWPIETKTFKHHIFTCTREEYQEERKNYKFEHKLWKAYDMSLILDFIKTIPFFSKLSNEEQIELYMSTGIAVNVLVNCYYAFEKKQHYISYPDGYCPIRLFEKPHPLEIDVNINSLKPFFRLELKQEEFCLLKILLFLSGNLTSFTEESLEIIRLEKEYYSSILLKYLQLEYGEVKGATRFTEITMLVQSIFIYIFIIMENVIL